MFSDKTGWKILEILVYLGVLFVVCAVIGIVVLIISLVF